MATQSIAVQSYALWNALFGLNGALSPNEVPLVASLCYYAATLLIGRVLHSANKALLPKSVQTFVADMITTFQVCACSLENVMIAKAYGFAAYGFTLFCLASWFALTVFDGRGNPCENVIDYMKGGQSFLRTFLRSCVQLLGGVLSYRYAQGFWYLQMTENHGERFQQLHCTAGLTVIFPVGFTIEFFGTLLQSFLAITTFTSYLVCEETSKALVGALLTCAGVHLTGMYLNPVNAFNQEFNCRGASAIEHVLIYWISPLAAAATAVWLQRHLKELTKTILTKERVGGKRQKQKGSGKITGTNAGQTKGISKKVSKKMNVEGKITNGSATQVRGVSKKEGRNEKAKDIGQGQKPRQSATQVRGVSQKEGRNEKAKDISQGQKPRQSATQVRGVSQKEGHNEKAKDISQGQKPRQRKVNKKKAT